MATPSNFTNQHVTPTGITASKPPVVTAVDHGFTNGQRVRATRFYPIPFATATGMEQLNNRLFTVQQVTADTFQLWDQYGFPIDATSYTTFVNNGYAQFTRTGPDLSIQNSPS